jgi:multisubunit Na+/H+ antiporter MnhB subunit
MQQSKTHTSDNVEKRAFYQLPKELKQEIVKVLPWIAMVGCGLSTIGVVYFVQIFTGVNQFGQIIHMLTGQTYVVGFMGWAALVVLAISAVMFFLAYKPLQVRKKSGWSLLYGLMFVYVIFAILNFLYDMQLVSLAISLVVDAIGIYLLVQVRSYYGKDLQ